MTEAVPNFVAGNVMAEAQVSISTQKDPTLAKLVTAPVISASTSVGSAAVQAKSAPALMMSAPVPAKPAAG